MLNNKFLKIIPTWFVILILCGMTHAAQAAGGTLVVIVHASNPVSALSPAEVKTYFMKTRTAWASGEKVRPVDQKSGTDRDKFLSDVLKVTDEELVRVWLGKQYATSEAPPLKVAGDEAAIKFVSTFKGGIGFIGKASLAASKDIKSVLEIDY